MNFEFSDDLMQLRDQARRYLGEHCTSKHVRAVLEGEKSYDGALWQGMADMGWLGAAIPEEYGGAGLGHEGLCVLAEEIGRAAAPVPFSSSLYLAAEAVLIAGSEDQKRRLLRGFAAGMHIGTLAWAEGNGIPRPGAFTPRLSGGKLTGTKWPVPDGGSADLCVVAAQNEAGQPILALADLRAGGVTRTPLETIDPARPQAKLDFTGCPAEQLGATGEGWTLLQRVLDRAAVLIAFEQVGGSDRALEMGRDYALDRIAFGRQIGSFQAVKHMLADMYVSATLARSNCYYGAWALSTNASELPEAAASARISATQAFQHCSKNNIQVHGGMGFTWEFDCHLYYRRSNALALGLGSLSYWEDQLIDRMRQRNAA